MVVAAAYFRRPTPMLPGSAFVVSVGSATVPANVIVNTPAVVVAVTVTSPVSRVLRASSAARIWAADASNASADVVWLA